MDFVRQAIKTGLTIEEDSFFGAILAGEQESGQAVHLFLSNRDLSVIQGFIGIVMEHKQEHDKFEKKLRCKHETVGGVCVNCGAKEEDYPELEAERFARQRPS